MIIACPKCKQRHDVSARAAGETFACACGNMLAVPKKAKGLGIVVILAIIAACSVPCLGILAAIAIPNFIKFQMRSKATEARANMMAIRTAERMHLDTNGKFLAFGPVPATVPPKDGVILTDTSALGELGWKPEGKIRYQYEVQVTGEKAATIWARADLDGDGEVAVYKLELDETGGGLPEQTNPGVF